MLLCHSCYSLLEGLPTPAELAEAAASAGWTALALTDHNTLTGAVEFYRACRRAGIQPILGLEVDLAWPDSTHKLELLATDMTGWASLCRISSALMLRGEEQPVCSLDLLAENPAGLLAVAPAAGESTAGRMAALAEVFPGQLYVSQPEESGEKALESAARLSLPVVAAHPVYSLAADQAHIQRLVAAIRMNTVLEKLPPGAAAPFGTHFLSPAQLTERYRPSPAALSASAEISARCTLELPIGKPHLPVVPVPGGLSPAEYLRRQSEDGARRLYGEITPDIRERLDHELSVIAGRGFEPVFLIVKELLDFARKQDIPTASRGSASSSLVAHCLGITTPDPLALDLYFERFLNPARATPPDIDTDIDSAGRDLVIQHAFEAFGAERVAMVGTINRFRPRSALSDAAKALGLPPERIRELAQSLPNGFWARRESNEDEVTPASPFKELEQDYPQYRSVFSSAASLLKLPRHLSVHAGGLVIAPGPLTDLIPVMRSGSKGITITQLDLESVEVLGLVKIDLLGIRGLTVLGDVAGAIHSWRRSEYRSRLEVLDAVPPDDPETADTVEHGRTIGCFQIESPGMQSTLRELRARCPDDIIAVLALYRPGPWQGGLKDAFVKRFRGEEPTDHIHPALAPLLADTFGVILYQEQVLRIAAGLAKFPLADADLLRRAMSHFDPGKKMQALKDKFVEQAEAHSGVPREVGERIWDMMAAFSGYGFPKAHAASYAQVAWRSAWCKTHFPAEFMAAVLANWGGYYPQRVYINEARRLKIPLHPPHINYSQHQFSAAYPQGEAVLYMGLDQVRDLTQGTQQKIIAGRPFGNTEDFLARVDPRRQEAENLVLAGALEGMGTIPVLLERVKSSGWRPGQMSLFPPETSGSEDWTVEQKMEAQQQVLGISLAAHPLELAAAKIAAANAITTAEAFEKVGQRVRVGGIRQTSHRSKTNRGEMMLFLTIEDLEGVLDVVIFPDVYNRVKSFIFTSAPLLITGAMEMDENRGEPLLRAEQVSLIQ